EPSDGLEPSTPSLPWRIRATDHTRPIRVCRRFRRKLNRSAARRSLPSCALNLPEKPRTCPQNLSPRRRSSTTTGLRRPVFKHAPAKRTQLATSTIVNPSRGLPLALEHARDREPGGYDEHINGDESRQGPLRQRGRRPRRTQQGRPPKE